MREYELVFIVHPDLDENATNEVFERVKGWITEAGGAINHVDPWGKRKLAYPIRKQNDGQYFLLKSQMSPSFIAELERNLRFVEPVMRFLITAIDEE
jgi:small subunit ribosomal protein S6